MSQFIISMIKKDIDFFGPVIPEEIKLSLMSSESYWDLFDLLFFSFLFFFKKIFFFEVLLMI